MKIIKGSDANLYVRKEMKKALDWYARLNGIKLKDSTPPATKERKT